MGEQRTLEQRIERLEAIVRDLEGDGLELEESLALFEEGIGHIRASERLLHDSRLRIERLLVDEDGAVTAQPIDDAE